GNKRCPACQKRHQHKLQAAGIDDRRDEQGPSRTKARLLQRDAKGKAQKEISAHDRNRLDKCIAQICRHIHSPFLCALIIKISLFTINPLQKKTTARAVAVYLVKMMRSLWNIRVSTKMHA